MREFVSLKPEAKVPLNLNATPPYPTVDIKESEKQIEISYKFEGFFRVERPLEINGRPMAFEAIDIPGTGHIVESGKPLLPSFGRYVHVPDGFDVRLLVNTPGKLFELTGINVAPAQEKLTDAVESTAVEYDAKFYEKDEWYPKELVQISGPYFMDGYRSMLVEVRPLQYNPKKKLLRAYKDVNVLLDLVAAPEKKKVINDPRAGLDAFGNLMLNPRRRVLDADLPAAKPATEEPELLIEYVAAFSDAARKLAHWKNQRGVVTRLALVDPAATPAALKKEIRQLRDKPGSRLRYVILFGDVDDIPTEETNLGNSTDYYYSTPEDVSAFMPLPMPWLSLGRIPVRSAAEAMQVVDQIIAYEKTPPADPSYYNRFLCAAYFQGSDGVETRGYMMTMERIRNFLVSRGYEAERVYTSGDLHPKFFLDGTPVSDEVKNAISHPALATQRLVEATGEGQVIMAHRDHGDVNGWSNPPFNVHDLAHVTGTTPSIFYSLNCLTGAWDRTTTMECFAEKNLTMPGSAPTLIAATELSGTFLNNDMMLALFDATYGGLLPTFPATTTSYPIRCNRIGDILNYSRFYLRTTSSSVNAVRDHCEIYHVLGDPSLEVWAREPQPLTVKAKVVSSRLNIELSALPPDCVVTIWHDNQLLVRKTPTNANFAIPLPQLPAPHPEMRKSKLVISAWAPGFRYAETFVTIPLPVPVPVFA